MWQCSPEGPLALDVEPHGRITVRLQPIDEIVETGAVCYIARIQTTREIMDLVRHGIPFAVELLWSSFWGSFDWMTLLDKGVQIYHLRMAVKRFQNSVSCNAHRKGSQSGENSSLRHVARDSGICFP